MKGLPEMILAGIRGPLGAMTASPLRRLLGVPDFAEVRVLEGISAERKSNVQKLSMKITGTLRPFQEETASPQGQVGLERRARMADLSQRKEDHIDLAVRGDVGFKRTTTLFECVRLVHDALPELEFEGLDLSTEILGKSLRAPIIIAAMTGGTERAGRINQELAALADQLGLGFGLGSQRAMLVRPECTPSFQVRSAAPNALILGNIGVIQARDTKTDDLLHLIQETGIDALCVHLNPAMELVQIDGDRDFRGALARLAELVTELPIPVIVKETGCGISPNVARRLRSVGVNHLDVSGAGGTSWVAVETHRAPEERRALGRAFWEWGVPTAASVALAAPLGFQTIIATGGISTGLEVAKALALGAQAAGIARPVLQAFESGGREGAANYLAQVELELKTALLLVGAPNLAALRKAPRLIRGELADWLSGFTE